MEPCKAVTDILLGQHLLSAISPDSVYSNLPQLQGSGFVLHTALGMLNMDLKRRSYRYTIVPTEVQSLLHQLLVCGEKAPRIGQNMFSPLMIAALIPGV